MNDDAELLNGLLMGMLSCGYNVSETPDVRLKTILEAFPEFRDRYADVLWQMGGSRQKDVVSEASGGRIRAGVIVRCERMYAEEFLGNQVRELSVLLGELEFLSLSHAEQIMAFTKDLDLLTARKQVERLRLMTRSYDSEIVMCDGLFWGSPSALVIQLAAQVARLSETRSGVWGSLGWRPLVWGPLRADS